MYVGYTLQTIPRQKTIAVSAPELHHLPKIAYLKLKSIFFNGIERIR